MSAPYRPIWVVAGLIFIAGMFVAAPVWAIPNTHLNDHPHDAGKVAYPGGGGGLVNHETTNHTHVSGIGITELGPGVPAGYMADPSAQWFSYAVWDDRFFRFADNAPADGNNSLAGQYGHGYIDPSFRPRYNFDATDYGGGGFNLATVQADVSWASSAWDAAAKAQGQNMRTTLDGTPLSTSVVFQDIGTAGGAEFLIDFVANYPGAFGEWVVSTAQTAAAPNGNGGLANPLTLAMLSNPTGSYTVDQAGWQISKGDGVFAATTGSIATPWHFGAAAPAAMGQDIDYKCVAVGGCGAGVAQNSVWEGNEGVFAALALTITDVFSSDGGAAAGDRPLFQADFRSVLLHEWGHVIGLLHSPAGIMNATAPFSLGMTSRMIDVTNALGAAALYSIPVPIPAAWLLFGSGLVVLRIFRRGRG